MTVAEKTSRNTTSPPEFKDPLTTYQERLESRNKTMAELDQIMDRLGLFRLLVFALGLVLAWLVFVSNFLHPAWMLVPIGAFLILVIRYNRIWLSWKRANRAARYYQFGIDRLQDKWHGRGNRGDRFLQEDHLYAADLDLFGKGTLFERLCIARTSLGEETLAGWLLNPAVAEEILARQKAVRDLRGR